MSYQQRAAPIDLASSNEHRNSPAPTYTSTMDSKDWPSSPHYSTITSQSSSHQPQFASSMPAASVPTSTANKGTEAVPPMKLDYQDPNHPHAPDYTSKPDNELNSTRHPRRRWPQKRVLIPWALAVIFFLTTLWFISIALGARFLSVLHPLPSYPTVQEIRIIVDQGRIETAIQSPSYPLSQTQPSSTRTIPSSTLAQTSASPSTTGSVRRAPNGPPRSEWLGDASDTILARSVQRRDAKATGFVTVTRKG